VGLGSNLADPKTQLTSALAELDALPQSRCRAHSSIYRSPPMPGAGVSVEQPDYLNAVAALDTTLKPGELLAALQEIEHRHQRERNQRWGPRTLDLDLLLYGEQQIDSPGLTVPHPGLYERNFVLYPLAELLAEQADDFQVPGRGSLASLLSACPRGELEQLVFF
jgi:2-amino-4-hydroxy-6-hydroxymethyldihydropteridine diphosphokinase